MAFRLFTSLLLDMTTNGLAINRNGGPPNIALHATPSAHSVCISRVIGPAWVFRVIWCVLRHWEC